MTEHADADLDDEVLRGIEGVDAVDDSSSSGLLPFDPRRKGPKDVARDTKRWASKRRYWLGAASLVALVVIHFRGLPVGLEDVPPWGWVSLLAGVVLVPVGVAAGVRTGKILSPSTGQLVSILDGRDGEQELLRIDDNRYRDLTVYDHKGDEQSREYLKDVTVNGEHAVECDVYYPRLNAAVASWQAGKSNHSIRKHEYAVDQIKTELDRAAQAGMQAEMEKPQEVAADVRKHSHVLIGAVEGVLTPEEVDLVSIRENYDESRMDPSEDHLAKIEDDLRSKPEDSNGHAEEADRIAEVKGQALDAISAVTAKVPGRGGKKGGGEA